MGQSNKYDSCRELIARAVVIQNDAVLVNRSHNHRTAQEYSALPGGHVEPGESCAAALQRELGEELGAEIAVGDLQFVIESVYAGRGSNDSKRHELVLYFAATLKTPLQESNGRIHSPEAKKNFSWLKLTEVANSNLLPEATRRHLQQQYSVQEYSAHEYSGTQSSIYHPSGLGDDLQPRYTFHDSTGS